MTLSIHARPNVRLFGGGSPVRFGIFQQEPQDDVPIHTVLPELQRVLDTLQTSIDALHGKNPGWIKEFQSILKMVPPKSAGYLPVPYWKLRGLFNSFANLSVAANEQKDPHAQALRQALAEPMSRLANRTIQVARHSLLMGEVRQLLNCRTDIFGDVPATQDLANTLAQAYRETPSAGLANEDARLSIAGDLHRLGEQCPHAQALLTELQPDVDRIFTQRLETALTQGKAPSEETIDRILSPLSWQGSDALTPLVEKVFHQAKTLRNGFEGKISAIDTLHSMRKRKLPQATATLKRLQPAINSFCANNLLRGTMHMTWARQFATGGFFQRLDKKWDTFTPTDKLEIGWLANDMAERLSSNLFKRRTEKTLAATLSFIARHQEEWDTQLLQDLEAAKALPDSPQGHLIATARNIGTEKVIQPAMALMDADDPSDRSFLRIFLSVMSQRQIPGALALLQEYFPEVATEQSDPTLPEA